MLQIKNDITETNKVEETEIKHKIAYVLSYSSFENQLNENRNILK